MQGTTTLSFENYCLAHVLFEFKKLF